MVKIRCRYFVRLCIYQVLFHLLCMCLFHLSQVCLRRRLPPRIPAREAKGSVVDATLSCQI